MKDFPGSAKVLQRVAMLSVHSSPLARLGEGDVGGMNVYVREVGRRLGQYGIACDIYTRQQSPDMPQCIALSPQARVIHIPAGPLKSYTKYRVWEYLPEFVAGVQSFIQLHGLQYDLLHSHYWLSGWVALQLRDWLHVPVIHMSHTLGHAKNAIAQHPEEREPLRRLQTEAEVLRESDVIVAESPASQYHLMQDYGVEAARIQVIPCGVDVHLFRLQSRQIARTALALPLSSPLLLFVGRLQALKGIDVLLRAAQLVCQRYENIQILIIGGAGEAQQGPEGVERRRLQALGEQLNLGKRLQFIEAQPQATLAQYYAAADVLVMPSYYESFGLVVLEAMACGLPVIASQVGGLASTVLHEQTGLLVPAGNWQAFAQAILRLLAAPHLREAYGEAGRERAQTFSWSRIVERTIQLYHRLIRQHGVVNR